MKRLQQQTDPGRWILNVPGNGADPCYIEDPQIIIQKWGANLRTNTINLESELRGVSKPLSRDCLGKDYTNVIVIKKFNDIKFHINDLDPFRINFYKNMNNEKESQKLYKLEKEIVEKGVKLGIKFKDTWTCYSNREDKLADADTPSSSLRLR
jgi:hypothetical protein